MDWLCKVVVHLLKLLVFAIWGAIRVVVHLLKLLVFAIWGAIRAIVPCRCAKLPDFGAEICLVTGAGQGLGRQLALKFAECGSTLVLWDINEEKVQAVAEEIRAMGRDAYAYVCDCSKRDEVYAVAAQVRREIGDVAILVNNAGVVSGKTLVDSKDEEIERTFGVNTLAHFWTVKAFLPWMLDNDYGYIVSVSSIMAFGGVPGLTDYCASKAAAYTFADALRQEFLAKKKTGISVTCVCPYHINTGMFNGVKSRFPSITKTLREEDVAERTVRGMAEKQFLVVQPRLMYLLIFMKSFLPTRAFDEAIRMLGADTAMDSFQGHDKED